MNNIPLSFDALVVTDLFGNPIGAWSIALLVAALAYVALRAALGLVSHRLGKLAARTTSRVDDAFVAILGRTRRYVLVAISLLIGADMLEQSEEWSARLDHAWFIVIGLQLALWVNHGISLWSGQYLQRETGGYPSATSTALSFILRVVLWATILLAILSNLGVNITAFVASLGIGGVAIALAVQNILGDLFASLSIALDKPFEIGDFIIVDDSLGTVEYIGLKTTRLRSLSGEQLIWSNKQLLERTIHNYKRMNERRILFGFGVTYQTPIEQVREIPDIVRRIIEETPQTRYDRAHFQKFGNSSLDFEVVYHVLDRDFNIYMDVQQHINLELMRELAARKVEFAYPTRTLHVVPPVAAA